MITEESRRTRGRRWYDGGPDFKHLFGIAFVSMSIGLAIGIYLAPDGCGVRL